MPTTRPDRIAIMDVPLTVFDSYEHAGSVIVQSVRQRQRASCVAINPVKVYTAWKDRQLWDTLHAADFCICDGVGVAVAARLLQGRAVTRITGVQLFTDLVAEAEARGLKVFLLGARPQANRLAYEKLRARHPKLQIVGRRDGYFDDSEAVIDQINESRADLLFVAMGSPRQEKWLARYRDRIDAPFCMGVGGSFDVLGGVARRAPRLFQKTGTEWLYRLVAHPRRLRHQMVLPLFGLAVIWRFLVAKVTPVSLAGVTRPLDVRRTPRLSAVVPDVADDGTRGDKS
jgi:N-acetylglucosaminyldiphosphoundecaprenol N-acetyl-beta-D-mannosaminyltransferase